LSQAALSGDLVHAVELEIDELADPDAGRAGEQQRVRGEGSRRSVKRFGESAVLVDG
jgi:hypothetical protein